MLITEISKGQYRLQLSDEELDHFRIILVNSNNLLISDLSSLFNFVLTWCEQRWYDTVMEPETDGT